MEWGRARVRLGLCSQANVRSRPRPRMVPRARRGRRCTALRRACMRAVAVCPGLSHSSSTGRCPTPRLLHQHIICCLISKEQQQWRCGVRGVEDSVSSGVVTTFGPTHSPPLLPPFDVRLACLGVWATGQCFFHLGRVAPCSRPSTTRAFRRRTDCGCAAQRVHQRAAEA